MSEDQGEGSSPYREGKPLAALIPPDRRRQKTLMLVGASMIVGACLLQAARMLPDLFESQPPTPVTRVELGRLKPVVLNGPDGARRIPGASAMVVHVWLQGCADCMPAFNAIQKIEDEGGLQVPVPVVNVAYGEADPTWAGRYRVRDNLVFDPNGASVVNPLGIRSFTTLVVDEDGNILLRDRPDRPGYVSRIQAIVGPERRNGTNGVHSIVLSHAPSDGQSLSAEDVEGVVMMHRQDVRRRCWEQGTKVESARISANLVVAASGEVLDASASGSDPELAACIAREVRTWRFPPRGHKSVSVVVPFQFFRQ